MSKFRQGSRVRILDNATFNRGESIDEIIDGDDTKAWLKAGSEVYVLRNGASDCDGDLLVQAAYPEDGDTWGSGPEQTWYVNENCVELINEPPAVHVGDTIRVRRTDEGVELIGEVTEISDIGDVTIGNYGRYVFNVNTVALPGMNTDVSIIKLAPVKWPDHDGFVKITGGNLTGRRAIVNGGLLILDNGLTKHKNDTLNSDVNFTFKYVEE